MGIILNLFLVPPNEQRTLFISWAVTTPLPPSNTHDIHPIDIVTLPTIMKGQNQTQVLVVVVKNKECASFSWSNDDDPGRDDACASLFRSFEFDREVGGRNVCIRRGRLHRFEMNNGQAGLLTSLLDDCEYQTPTRHATNGLSIIIA